MFYKIKTNQTNLPKININNLGFNTAKKFINGHLEYVHVDNFTVVCDEDGKLKNLPVNKLATMLAGFTVVGDAIIVTKDILEQGV